MKNIKIDWENVMLWLAVIIVIVVGIISMATETGKVLSDYTNNKVYDLLRTIR